MVSYLPLPRRGALSGKSARTCRRWRLFSCVLVLACSPPCRTAEIEHRHNAPIQTALPKEASDYEWKRETGEVQSYQHTHAGSWLHIDPQGQFYDCQAQPITRETALEQAGQSSAHSMGDTAQVQSGSKDTTDLGLGL
jgi:hypothetical protein